MDTCHPRWMLCTIVFCTGLVAVGTPIRGEDYERPDIGDIGVWSSPDGDVQVWMIDDFLFGCFKEASPCSCGGNRNEYFFGKLLLMVQFEPEDPVIGIKGNMTRCTDPELLKDCPELPCVWEAPFFAQLYSYDDGRTKLAVIKGTYEGEWYEQDDEGKYICTPDHTFEGEFEISRVVRVSGPTLGESWEEFKTPKLQRVNDFLKKAGDLINYLTSFKWLWDPHNIR